MKPKLFGKEFLDKAIELKPGVTVMILDEIRPMQDINPRFMGWLGGTVEWDGEEYLLSLNKTSYKTIAAKYGVDTKDWINKEIMYAGVKKMGNMQGKLWEAV